MKILLTFLLTYWVAGPTWGQAPASLPVDKTTHRISYTGVVPVVGISQADLLARACVWANEMATLDKPLVVTSRQDAEVLVAFNSQPFVYTYATSRKATTNLQHYTIKLVLHYTAKVSLREGRYRYEVTDFVFEYPNAKPPLTMAKMSAEGELIEAFAINEEGARMGTALRTSFDKNVTKLLANLNDVMSKPITKSGAK